jgi:NAD(P)-dependent dehydrogenase (short-subunit alcohol dehydrogenase family)
VTESNPFSLEGKVALITGGGRGIGAGIAKSLAQAGAAVALVSRTKEQVDAVAAEITSAGGRALALPADLNDVSALDGLFERTVEEFGGLDILVNNAGGGNMWRPILDETGEDIDKEFHFHVTVPFELVHRAVPYLLERPGASIINVVSGAIQNPTRGHLSYDAAKGAFHYATRSMAAGLGPKIRVNSINPGIIETEAMKAVTSAHESVLEQLVGRVRLRRLGTPEDIGRAAVFLASPAASYITGVALDVDGGAVGEMNAMFPDL